MTPDVSLDLAAARSSYPARDPDAEVGLLGATAGIEIGFGVVAAAKRDAPPPPVRLAPLPVLPPPRLRALVEPAPRRIVRRRRPLGIDGGAQRAVWAMSVGDARLRGADADGGEEALTRLKLRDT